MTGWLWWAAGGGLLLMLVLCRRPLTTLCRLAVRSGLGMVFLFIFQVLGGLLVVTLVLNMLNGMLLFALCNTGFAMMLLTQWTGR